ncbi:hypothetical protein Nstercoris_00417 [Nitrosomonas stercoris]|uniref:Uncharacterized protein n=1 Tax=Nitrosomonas stercoris TaxID=1444684 RepID=A0A4Y1YJE2_9PROT|nr:hypothetical protein Nstercoris_00417 [Nitrosomonas stercoris]
MRAFGNTGSEQRIKEVIMRSKVNLFVSTDWIQIHIPET